MYHFSLFTRCLAWIEPFPEPSWIFGRLSWPPGWWLDNPHDDRLVSQPAIPKSLGKRKMWIKPPASIQHFSFQLFQGIIPCIGLLLHDRGGWRFTQETRKELENFDISNYIQKKNNGVVAYQQVATDFSKGKTSAVLGTNSTGGARFGAPQTARSAESPAAKAWCENLLTSSASSGIWMYLKRFGTWTFHFTPYLQCGKSHVQWYLYVVAMFWKFELLLPTAFRAFWSFLTFHYCICSGLEFRALMAL